MQDHWHEMKVGIDLGIIAKLVSKQEAQFSANMDVSVFLYT